MIRADDVTVAFPLFQAGSGGSNPTSALDLHFSRIERDVFQSLNRLWHSSMPKINSSFALAHYGAEFDGRFHAVAMWSNPVARLLPQRSWLELRRFAIGPESPKNTASRMIAWMVRDIRRSFPGVERLISYQDVSRHAGTIQSVSARIRWELRVE